MSEHGSKSAHDAADASTIGSRRAEIVSDVDVPATVAAAIAPDDTDEIDTRVEDGRIVTTIERETTGGLEATIDDYVVALDVAVTIANAGSRDGSADRTDASTDGTHASEDAAESMEMDTHSGTAEQSSDQPNTDTL